MKNKEKISTIIKLSFVVLIVGGIVTLILNNKVYFGGTDMQTFGTRNLEIKSKYSEITEVVTVTSTTINASNPNV